MNSICSKNDHSAVLPQFLTQGYRKYWQYFLFPSINWAPKGERVKSIISSMNLREENVIIIDDNEANINEIKYYCPNIMSALPEQIAKIAEEAGASAITIHGRTRSEFYTGKADWEIIKKVKESVKIPVIGNGDVVDEETALQMFETTGVDGIMIGRASFGNPWIFKNIIHYLNTGEKLSMPTNEERLRTMKKQIELSVEEKGEIAVKELRKHIAWYTKNLKNSSEFRNSINKIETKEELINKLDEYFKPGQHSETPLFTKNHKN